MRAVKFTPTDDFSSHLPSGRMSLTKRPEACNIGPSKKLSQSIAGLDADQSVPEVSLSPEEKSVTSSKLQSKRIKTVHSFSESSFQFEECSVAQEYEVKEQNYQTVQFKTHLIPEKQRTKEQERIERRTKLAA